MVRRPGELLSVLMRPIGDRDNFYFTTLCYDSVQVVLCVVPFRYGWIEYLWVVCFIGKFRNELPELMVRIPLRSGEISSLAFGLNPRDFNISISWIKFSFFASNRSTVSSSYFFIYSNWSFSSVLLAWSLACWYIISYLFYSESWIYDSSACERTFYTSSSASRRLSWSGAPVLLLHSCSSISTSWIWMIC